MDRLDDLTKFAITGYVREYEHGNDAHLNVPMAIQYLIMQFYWIAEKFTLHGDYIELNEDGNIATFVGQPFCYNTVYGNNVINFDDRNVIKYKWTFKILHGAERNLKPIAIGIDSSTSTTELINNDFSDNSVNGDPFYGIVTNGCSFDNYRFDDMISGGFKNGDSIVLVSDTDEQTLMCESQGATYCVAKRIVCDGRKYNVAVAMSCTEDSVQLVKFESVRREQNRTDLE